MGRRIIKMFSRGADQEVDGYYCVNQKYFTTFQEFNDFLDKQFVELFFLISTVSGMISTDPSGLTLRDPSFPDLLASHMQERKDEIFKRFRLLVFPEVRAEKRTAQELLRRTLFYISQPERMFSCLSPFLDELKSYIRVIIFALITKQRRIHKETGQTPDDSVVPLDAMPMDRVMALLASGHKPEYRPDTGIPSTIGAYSTFFTTSPTPPRFVCYEDVWAGTEAYVDPITDKDPEDEYDDGADDMDDEDDGGYEDMGEDDDDDEEMLEEGNKKKQNQKRTGESRSARYNRKMTEGEVDPQASAEEPPASSSSGTEPAEAASSEATDDTKAAGAEGGEERTGGVEAVPAPETPAPPAARPPSSLIDLTGVSPFSDTTTTASTTASTTITTSSSSVDDAGGAEALIQAPAPVAVEKFTLPNMTADDAIIIQQSPLIQKLLADLDSCENAIGEAANDFLEINEARRNFEDIIQIFTTQTDFCDAAKRMHKAMLPSTLSGNDADILAMEEETEDSDDEEDTIMEDRAPVRDEPVDHASSSSYSSSSSSSTSSSSPLQRLQARTVKRVHKCEETCSAAKTRLESIVSISASDPLPSSAPISGSIDQFGSKLGRVASFVHETLRSSPGEKFLIFSQFSEALQQTAALLVSRGISVTSARGMPGASGTIASRINKFVTDPNVQVLLLHSVKQCAGLNLTVAPYVFLLDQCDLDKEAQAIGRAVRIGQTRNVCVVRFDTPEIVTAANELGLAWDNKGVLQQEHAE
eukprot:TRINITY_DN3070_c1_g1_i1.p1 TRINITY_DN3070_c1_g1~~TRINITY_DN3070_c1_g1_i1.p1  ORF type:complete len:857 (-),score=198.10 TRINITY_DN3070_c1_g1_i1:73-2343(-)